MDAISERKKKLFQGKQTSSHWTEPNKTVIPKVALKTGTLQLISFYKQDLQNIIQITSQDLRITMGRFDSFM